MNTSFTSKAVQNELNAINEQEQKAVTKKRINVELICALLTMGAIIGGFALLSHFGYIREF